jgi:hypothetical protein
MSFAAAFAAFNNDNKSLSSSPLVFHRDMLTAIENLLVVSHIQLTTFSLSEVQKQHVFRTRAHLQDLHQQARDAIARLTPEARYASPVVPKAVRRTCPGAPRRVPVVLVSENDDAHVVRRLDMN